MSVAQFHKGLDNVRSAIDVALRDHNIQGAVVSQSTHGSEPGDAVFTVTVMGQVVDQKFTREEIEDSGQAIDHFAAMKVRTLVSPFVR
jgi:hypothetical protein